ncbi:hypothetical protein BKA70DRAFT_1493303 [Coprinopsis sp. MPI-PUGE-AT-0042]|nr:hypothetical protein BKA70DRAFT_1493303 [Coprinopsis sp. MPI-PUGE-AT-0042]
MSLPGDPATRLRSASDLGSEATRRLVAHRSATQYIQNYTETMKTEISKAYPMMDTSDQTKIIDLAFNHSNIFETIEQVLRQNEELVREFAELTAKEYTVNLKSFSSLKTQDALCILGRSPHQINILGSTATCAAFQTSLLESSRRDIAQDFEETFERCWLERSEFLQTSLKAICATYGSVSESRARTVVELQLRDLVPFLGSLTQKMFLFPEVTVATKARGPMVVASGKYAYLLTGSIVILVISAAVPHDGAAHGQDLDPGVLQSPEAVQLPDITKALNRIGVQGKIDFPSVRFIPVELKKLAVAGSMRATSRNNMSFVLSDGETWVLGCVRASDGGVGQQGYDCYITAPYNIPLSTTSDFSGPLKRLMKMLGLLLFIEPEVVFDGFVDIGYNAATSD